MEVKIYREPENESLILDEVQLAEYNDLALELGFGTQSNIEEQNVPNIYVSLNLAMEKQLKAVCPMKVDADKYNKSTIPLEVLKVYKFAKDNKMFDGFHIWYNDVDPDPLLIGWNWKSATDKEKDYTWNLNRFLIARWGDCALELPQLLELGFNKMKQELMDKAQSAIDKCNSVLSNPDIYVRKILSNTTEGDISLNINSSGTIY
ncbi:MAG: hypothetical protein JHC33_11260 [Ignisphaera sp.]|nr:hypothetical protein [Ignisphaera sp.]